MTMQPSEIFEKIKTMRNLSQLKAWLEELGYEYDAEFTDFSDEHAHSNYQNHFHLHTTIGTIQDVLRNNPNHIILYNNYDEEVIAGDARSTVGNFLYDDGNVHRHVISVN